jgi:two component regulator with propeller domain
MMPSSARERSPILNRARGLFAAIVVGALLGHASPAAAVKTSFWRTDDMAGFLQGEHVEGVALESDGYLTLGPSWDSVVTRLEGVSYIWSIARDSKGRIYFGTGDNGRIYRWTRGKGATLVWETGAGEITSLAVDRADNVYAGSAPGGIVYRVGAAGDTSRYFETGEESIWSLLAGKDGSLYAGTGSKGKIYRITAAKKGTVLAETKDVNVLSLAETSDGALLAGTASKGLLMRIDKGGGSRVLFDSDSDELRGIAVLPDGSIVVGTNRQTQARGASDSSDRGSSPGGDSRYAIDVTPSGGGKCGVFLVQPDGSARLLFAPPTDFIYAMVPEGPKSVLVATGESAALFRVSTDKKYALLGVPEEKQILAVARSGNETWVGTGNDAVLYELSAGPAKEGSYTSQPYDLHSVASWGRVTAGLTGSGDVLWSTRSGLSEEPDEGWSGWSKEAPLRGSTPIDSPPARFLQYRLTLKRGGNDGPVVSWVEIAYQQRNLPPEIGDIKVYGPDNPYMEGGPDYRPPQISQSFPSGLKVEYNLPRTGPKPVSDASAAWARGVRTVSWEALDPNGDGLKYDVSIKADDEKDWRPLVSEHTERVYSFDSESYANGEYRVKVEATDLPDNPPSAALHTERTGTPFEIDNVPPRIENLKTSGGSSSKAGLSSITVSGSAIDADTRITTIEYSVDGGDWTDIFPEDGMFDEKEEAFRFEVKDLMPGEHRVTVRASDLERNVAVGKVLTVTR